VPPAIPDKLEIRYRQQPSSDTLQEAFARTEKELEEMRYYLRIHNVTDEGYHLVAQYNTTLQQRSARINKLLADSGRTKSTITRHLVKAQERPMIAVKTAGGYWRAGHFHTNTLSGQGIVRDSLGRIVCAVWNTDTIVTAVRYDSLGTYRGQMNQHYQATGQGTFDTFDGAHYEGFWQDDKRHGFGFESSPDHQVRVGEWKEGKFLGERLRYTSERIYGIDISRHQHEKGHQRFGINWNLLRITSLGKKHDTEGRTYPVSFMYIKSTEGVTIRNRYFVNDYANAKKQGIKVGAYHFFSTHTSAQEQATWFLRNTLIRHDDFPPVLDVEPSDAQIAQMGGGEELLRRMRQWLKIVEQHSGKRPILYVNQMFIKKYMYDAADLKKNYNIWIARYGEYKPDVKLVYWQLTPDGRVDGITGPVDINVFNGYQNQFDEFVRTGFHK
jgi:lysozyme